MLRRTNPLALALLALASCRSSSPQTQPKVVAGAPMVGELTETQYQVARAFNDAYSRESGYSKAPNAFLARCLDVIATQQPPSDSRGPSMLPALDVACGEGRNSLLLAQRGYDVTAFDLSDVGVQATLTKATLVADSHTSTWGRLTAFLADAYLFDYGEERWNLVTLMYFMPRDDILSRITRSVRPGGWIVIEHRSAEARGPIDASRETLRNRELKLLLGWDVYLYEHVQDVPDWQSGSGRPSAVLRVLARKPPQPSS